MGNWLKQYMWIVDLIAVLIGSFFLAKITSVYIARSLEVTKSIAMLKPTEIANPVRKGVSLDDYEIIIQRNIFDSSDVEMATTAEEESENVYQTTGDAIQTSLGIKVLGVLVVGEGKDPRSSATVKGIGKKNEVDVYAVGSVNGFAPSTKLVQIKPDRIEFIHSGRLEYATIEDALSVSIFGPPTDVDGGGSGTEESSEKGGESGGSQVAAVGEGKYVIDQNEIDNALQNMDQLFTQIRAVPNFKGGKVSGMRILSVQPGSVFAKLGLKRGDILERINSLELDVKQGFEIFNQLKDQKSLTLDLVRNGQKQSYEYTIQ